MTLLRYPAPTYRAEPGLLAVYWHAEPTPAVLKTEYNALLDHAPVARLLLDVRARMLPSVETVNWVTLNWLPRAAAWCAPHLLRLAYVLPPARAAELAADYYLSQSLHDALAPRPSYQVALFADEPAARHWLLG